LQLVELAASPLRVVLTRRLPAALLARLRAALPPGAALAYHDSDAPMPRAELLAACAGASALLCTLSDAVDEELVRAAGASLRVVSTMSVGYSHCDVAALRAARARLGHTPGVLTDATADLVLGLLLATSRRIVEAAAAARSGAWAAWQPFWMTGKELSGARVGVIGMGRIGAAVARRLRGFGCEVVYDGRSGAKPELDAALGTRWLPRAELLASSDFVVCVCALTAETRGMLGAAAFAQMRDDVVFVNASRGEVVDQPALLAALEARPRMRAGLDVCSPEPLPLDHPLLAHPRCLVLPHIGSAGERCRERMAELMVDNALAALAGDGAPMPAEVAL